LIFKTKVIQTEETSYNLINTSILCKKSISSSAWVCLTCMEMNQAGSRTAIVRENQEKCMMDNLTARFVLGT